MNTINIQKYEMVSNFQIFGNDCAGEPECLIDQQFSLLTMMGWQNNTMIPFIFKDNHHIELAKIHLTECCEYYRNSK